MDCLTMILSCLLNGTYVSAGLETELYRPAHEGRWCGNAARRWPESGYCTGPMGVLKLGSRLELTKRIDLDLGFAHSSFINADDQGVQSVYLTLTWRPFRGR